MRTQIVDGLDTHPLPTIRPMDYKKAAGKRLKAAREAKKLTLDALSGLTKGLLSKSRLGNYEQGTRMIGVEETLALASVLEVNPAYLLCVDVEDEEMTPQEKSLLRDFRALPENDRADYARRIGVLAMAYKEPVPDERVESSGFARRTTAPQQK
jgi:transcriptional regulator with XRE-family HTH domain